MTTGVDGRSMMLSRSIAIQIGAAKVAAVHFDLFYFAVFFLLLCKL